MKRLTREPFKLFSINGILDSDLDLLKVVQDVKLGEVKCVVAVDEGRVLHNDEIEPAATSTTTCCDTKLRNCLPI